MHCYTTTKKLRSFVNNENYTLSRLVIFPLLLRPREERFPVSSGARVISLESRPSPLRVRLGEELSSGVDILPPLRVCMGDLSSGLISSSVCCLSGWGYFGWRVFSCNIASLSLDFRIAASASARAELQPSSATIMR